MFSAIFIDRPRLATVIAIVTTIAGLLSLLVIPIAQYPDIVPPQVSVTTTLSRRLGCRRRGDGRAADRKPGRRRRQDDLHEERQRQRRQLLAEGVVRARHRSGHQHGQRQQPRAGRAVEAAGGRAQPGRDGQEAVVRAARRHRAVLAQADATTSCSSRTTRRSTCSIRSRARRASAMPRCSVRRITRCGPGCAPTADRARPDHGRRHQRDQVAERPGGGRPARRSADLATTSSCSSTSRPRDA